MPTVSESPAPTPIPPRGVTVQQLADELGRQGIKLTPLHAIRRAVELGLGEDEAVRLAAEARRRLEAAS